jgi:hypothetical protein
VSPSEANRKQMYRIADAVVVLSLAVLLSTSKSAPVVCDP